MLRISIRQLEYMRAVVDEGGLAQAARKMGVSTSAIAGSIDKLESVTGLRLFDRFPASGMQLTGQGAQLFEMALSTLAAAEALERRSKDLQNITSGTIKLGCYPSLASLFAPAILVEHKIAWPGMIIEIVEATFSQLTALLERGDIDAALTYDQGLDPVVLQLRKLKEVRPRVLIAQSHPLASRLEISAQDLAYLPFVEVTDRDIGPTYLSSLQAFGIDPPIAARVQSYELARSCVGLGLGFALAAFDPLSPSTYQGDAVVSVPLAEELPSFSIVWLTHRATEKEPPLRDLSDLCFKVFQSQMG